MKKLVGRPGVWEFAWADDGGATFSFAESVVTVEVYIVWRRVGTHDVLGHPKAP